MQGFPKELLGFQKELEGFQKGASTQSFAEFIDIYPTLCDLSGLSKPSHLQGLSQVPVLKNPSTSAKDFAIGRYRSGDTIRTDQFRFTTFTGEKGNKPTVMLYDHTRDPLENVNIAGEPQMKETVKRLTRLLNEHKGRPFQKK